MLVNYKGERMKKILIILFFCIIQVFAFEELTSSNFDTKIKNQNVIVEFYASY